MEKLLNELRILSQSNKEMEIFLAVEYDNTHDEWALCINSSQSCTHIYYEYAKDLKELEILFENGKKELKKFIDEFEWEY